MAWDWTRFLDQHRIEYNQSGANTSRDNVTIHCPFCGSQDPSKHMSVNTAGKGWRCWRNTTHRGKNPARLVQALLNVTISRANEIVGNSIYVPNDLMARLHALSTPPVKTEPTPLPMPPEFKALAGLPTAKPYERYLHEDRGFSWKQIDTLTPRYDVRYCTRGAYAGRIIFPIKFKGKLVAWTGRTISRREELRYRALSTDPERALREGYPAALGAISHYLLWYDQLRQADADTLMLMEGPFDALKTNVLGRRDGITATCFFTAEPTASQVDLLHEVIPRFKRCFLVLDRGTLATSIRVVSTLRSLGVIPAQLPDGVKDPGEFDLSTFGKFLFALRRRGA